MDETSFEDRGRIARGGMAEVRRVHDRMLRRDLALKVLSRALSEQPEEVERFVEEAQVTAQLDHPYVPPVHDMGVAADGRHFFTMKLVEGRTLEDVLREVPGPAAGDRLFSLVQVFLKVCEAVSFAHARGVVHCDLKPGNVMVGSHGQVYVMDWGIARLALDRADGAAAERPVSVARTEPRREARGVHGSLGYLSPEQASCRVDEIDERSDVFSLGAMLYRIVVGETIYPVAPVNEALARAIRADVTPIEPTSPGKTLPRRLCAIALRALKASREERYPTVEALRAEVHAWVRGVGRHPTRVFAPGEVILREGEPGDSAFVVSRGRVEVFKTIHGRRQPLAQLGPGAIFGEAAIFGERGRTATVEAVEETVAVEVSRESLEEELEGTFVVGDLLRVLARRFQELDAQARTLRERVDDWALHGTVMGHFAMHGEVAGESERHARWAPLRQAMEDHLGIPRERARAWAESLRGVRVDEPSDRVVLDVTSGVPLAPTAVTVPELVFAAEGEAEGRDPDGGLARAAGN